MSSDRDVRVADQSDAATKSGSLNRGNDRLARAGAKREEPLMNSSSLRRIRRRGFVKIHARTEDIPLRIQENRPDRSVVLSLIDRVGNLAAQIRT